MTDWADIIRDSIRHSLDGVHTSVPATVTGYLPLLQVATCQPVVEGMPEIPDVPVCWPRGGGYGLHMPLEAGDTVLLVFAEQDFGPWRLTGSAQAPALLRRHGLYSVAIPGGAPDISPMLSPALYSGAVLGQDSVGGTVLHVSDAGVEVGVGPVFTQQVALAALVQAAGPVLLAALVNASAAAVTAAAGTPDGGIRAFGAFSSALSASLLAWPGPVGSSMLRCSS
jgi:hypothetical protein